MDSSKNEPNTNNVKTIEGVQFLESLENLYNKEGISGIVRFVRETFSIGTLVDLQQGTSSNELYHICNRVVWKLDPQGNLTNSTLLPPLDIENEACGVIRVFALPYVDEPFQVELYGERV